MKPSNRPSSRTPLTWLRHTMTQLQLSEPDILPSVLHSCTRQRGKEQIHAVDVSDAVHREGENRSFRWLHAFVSLPTARVLGNVERLSWKRNDRSDVHGTAAPHHPSFRMSGGGGGGGGDGDGAAVGFSHRNPFRLLRRMVPSLRSLTQSTNMRTSQETGSEPTGLSATIHVAEARTTISTANHLHAPPTPRTARTRKDKKKKGNERAPDHIKPTTKHPKNTNIRGDVRQTIREHPSHHAGKMNTPQSTNREGGVGQTLPALHYGYSSISRCTPSPRGSPFARPGA